jgi:hypothetical protein
LQFAIFKPFIGAKLRKRVRFTLATVLMEFYDNFFISFSQIHFMNKDWNSLTAAVGSHAVRKEFGGDLPVDDVDGKLLTEFLKLFDPQFECKN